MIYKNADCPAKKTSLLHYKGQLVNAVQEMISVSSENHAQRINTTFTVTGG
jgi:hypothetical protein